jgi:hypothetical protein
MGRNLHHAVRTEGGVPEFDRLLEPGERRRLTQSRATATMFACAAALILSMLAVPDAILAADTSSQSQEKASSEENSAAACNSIKTALHALAAAEQDESLALDLAAEGGSPAIVEARLSGVLDRTQDLRAVLKRVRHSAVARTPMVDQCTRMGFRALVTSEKLSSDVETVLSGSEDSMVEAPEPKTGRPAPAPAQLPQH